jgi:enoyl-CoA hydratase
MAIEEEIYHGLCWRWRNFRKPTIAQVQGKVIAGGLMPAWVCDLIVAADDAEFSDPVVAFGLNGHESLCTPEASVAPVTIELRPSKRSSSMSATLSFRYWRMR